MDEIREDKLIHYRRIESIIQSIEEDETKKKQLMEAIRRKAETNKTHIGPANDLLRFLYILEQQYQSDSEEIRTKSRERVLEYLDQYRQSDDVIEEEEEEEEEEPKSEPNRPDDTPQPVSVIPAVPVSIIAAVPISVIPAIPESPIVQPPPSQPTVPVKSQPSITVPVTDADRITPHTLKRYQELQAEVRQYEIQYETVDPARKKQLIPRLKNILNKLRKDTFDTLTKELFDFLNGQEQIISGQTIRVSTAEERLLCFSILSTLILQQLLGGDVTDIKSDIFIPLIAKLCENGNCKEFGSIFLERLYKKCPYTIPQYPQLPTVVNEKYYEAMGYVEKKDGEQIRWETETEFLNRMNGLIRLFCKILVRGVPPFDTSSGLAWTWMSDVLNLPPRPNLTAVLIRVFLDEAGSMMMQTYGKQFSKLIPSIRRDYLTRLEKTTSDDLIARLRLTLDNINIQS